MAYKSVTNGIIFVEGSMDYIRDLGPIKYTKDGFYNQQLKNLDDIKAQLATKARQMGANCIINFKYGQKSTSWFRAALLSLDDNVNWYAEGTAGVMPQGQYEELIEEISKR